MNTAKKEVKKNPKLIQKPWPKKTNKVKTPKVKLISYEVKAIIPVGMYANIQPGIIVEAETLEQAERAVMPHIEALFAKYREGGPMTVTTVPVKKVTPEQVVKILDENKVTPDQVMSSGQTSPTPATTPAIPMSEPYNRAKRAIESATSLQALEMIEKQVTDSVKLIATEKQEMFGFILLKRKELNG